MHPTKIQRWSGLTRTVNDWDHGLRRVCWGSLLLRLADSLKRTPNYGMRMATATFTFMPEECHVVARLSAFLLESCDKKSAIR